MVMFANTNRAVPGSNDYHITLLLISGFTGQLKGWWDNYLTDEQRLYILTAYKINEAGIRILDNNGQPIPDMLNTLIFSISQHFIGDSSHIRDRSLELLSNLKCKSLGEFRQYKDIFFQKVFLRDDCNQPFWKEKFLAGLPSLIGDQVRNKIREDFNGEIPYNNLSYGELASYVNKIGTNLCITIRLQKRLKNERKLTK